jgi:hypothetical protein
VSLATAIGPRWVLVLDARTRCTRCAKLVTRSWRWFPTPSTSTLCYCEPCVDELLA